MNKQNETALRKAWDMVEDVQNYVAEGNLEMAHRSTSVYQSIMLTVLVTELVPGAQDVLDAYEKAKKKPVRHTSEWVQ